MNEAFKQRMRLAMFLTLGVALLVAFIFAGAIVLVCILIAEVLRQARDIWRQS